MTKCGLNFFHFSVFIFGLNKHVEVLSSGEFTSPISHFMYKISEKYLSVFVASLCACRILGHPQEKDK